MYMYIPAVSSPFPCWVFPFPHSLWFPGRFRWPLVQRPPFLAHCCLRFSHWTWSQICCGSCSSCRLLQNDECKKLIDSSIYNYAIHLLNVVHFVLCTIIVYLCTSIKAIYLCQLIRETNGILDDKSISSIFSP